MVIFIISLIRTLIDSKNLNVIISFAIIDLMFTFIGVLFPLMMFISSIGTLI